MIRSIKNLETQSPPLYYQETPTLSSQKSNNPN